MTAIPALNRPLRIPRGLPRAVLATGLGALALAACDDDSVVRRGIDTLGADFVRAFNQAPNDDPLDASALDLTLTPTIEPFDP